MPNSKSSDRVLHIFRLHHALPMVGSPGPSRLPPPRGAFLLGLLLTPAASVVRNPGDCAVVGLHALGTRSELAQIVVFESFEVGLQTHRPARRSNGQHRNAFQRRVLDARREVHGLVQ